MGHAHASSAQLSSARPGLAALGSPSPVSPAGLKFLKRMHLAHVNLDGTGVSLAGVTDLLTLKNISSIRASNTRSIPLDDVSDEEWETQ